MGSHLLFKYVDGVKNQTGRLGPGIDVKSNGGYIIAPPSSHQSGRVYGWALGCGPDEVEAAVPPDWLVILLRDGDRPKSANGSLSETILSGASEHRKRTANPGGFSLGERTIGRG